MAQEPPHSPDLPGPTAVATEGCLLQGGLQ